MKYKAVIFDLFGTLVEKFPVDESIDVLVEMAAVLKVSSDEFVRLWFDTFNERHSGCFPDLESDIEYVSGRMGVRPEPEQLKTAAQINLDYVATHIVPLPGAVELLEYLKSNGYKIGLVSNWSDEVPTVWEDIPLSKYFDTSVFSCKAGMMKPDPRIYTMALEQLSLEPEACIYIGDGDSSEIAGASEVGMTAVLVSGSEPEDWQGKRITSLEEVRALLDG
jgi:putative hydrolase of the HAD superfamily